MASSNHRNALTLARPFGSCSVPLRLLTVLLFAASFGFRPAEPCWAGRHHADVEAAGEHEATHQRTPGPGHRDSEHNSEDCCCASASPVATRGEAASISSSSTIQENIRVAVLVSGVVFRSPFIPDNSWMLQGRDHAPPDVPLFITFKALLI